MNNFNVLCFSYYKKVQFSDEKQIKNFDTKRMILKNNNSLKAINLNKKIDKLYDKSVIKKNSRNDIRILEIKKFH